MVEEIKKHKEKFGVEPIIIGMFWNSPDKVANDVLKKAKILVRLTQSCCHIYS